MATSPRRSRAASSEVGSVHECTCHDDVSGKCMLHSFDLDPTPDYHPPCVINRRSGKPYDVYIGRGSKWGNPFSHQRGTRARYVVATREAAAAAYERYIFQQPQLMGALHELKGKRLGCYCAPLACHGDVLLRLANAYPD